MLAVLVLAYAAATLSGAALLAMPASIAAALVIRRRWPRFRPACYGVIAGSSLLLVSVAVAYGNWALRQLL